MWLTIYDVLRQIWQRSWSWWLDILSESISRIPSSSVEKTPCQLSRCFVRFLLLCLYLVAALIRATWAGSQWIRRRWLFLCSLAVLFLSFNHACFIFQTLPQFPPAVLSLMISEHSIDPSIRPRTGIDFNGREQICSWLAKRFKIVRTRLGQKEPVAALKLIAVSKLPTQNIKPAQGPKVEYSKTSQAPKTFCPKHEAIVQLVEVCRWEALFQRSATSLTSQILIYWSYFCFRHKNFRMNLYSAKLLTAVWFECETFLLF